ncbi:unnamed protein product [Diatraea saccharalis]|nr:unnamed protein product [Diatraea saccharalis]
MFEENEDEITDLYKNRPEDDVMPDAEKAICFNHTNYCEQWMLPNEEDTTWTDEMEQEYIKIHGPDPYGFGGLGGMGAPPSFGADDIEEEDLDAEEPEAKDEL